MLEQLEALYRTLHLLDFIDMAIVSLVLYRVYLLLKNTRAASLVKGLIVLILATLLSSWLELHVINWLLQKSITVLLVALPVVFQPELRRALEHLGRGKFFGRYSLDDAEVEGIISSLSNAAFSMSKHKIGALIVIERETGLDDYIETGIKLDGLVSSEFLINIFIPNTPLHDGAIIIRGNRIIAASCLLPLSEVSGLSKELGTRHRAAIGLSEQTDAMILVVSEETGTISLSSGGHLRRGLTKEDIKKALYPALLVNSTSIKETTKELFRSWRRK